MDIQVSFRPKSRLMILSRNEDMKKRAILVVIALLSGLVQAACEISIAVNQVGYLPEAPKWCRCEKRFYHNQRQRPVFGQFFPSKPQIPGAMIHAATGEYDMPAVAMVLWATHRL